MQVNTDTIPTPTKAQLGSVGEWIPCQSKRPTPKAKSGNDIQNKQPLAFLIMPLEIHCEL